MVTNKNNRKQKTVLFYASTPTKKMFSVQRFYRTDIQILRDLGFKVRLSNFYMDFFRFWTYDIAFIYFYRYGILPAILSKLFFKKVIFTGGIDNLDQHWASKRAYQIQKLFFRLCTFISDINILVSIADVNNIKAFKPVLKENKYPLSFHVIDFDSYRKDTIEGKEKVLTTIAWMYDEDNIFRKGVDKSLFFFKQLHQIDPDFRMIIVGPHGIGTNLVEEIIRKEGLEDLVTLTGSIGEKEKIDILKRSSVYTQLSIYEGFGIAAVEALAAGNIVLHTGKGGLSDGIGNCGILATNSQWGDYAKNILEILSDQDRWETYVKTGVSHVSSHFDYSTRLQKFEEILFTL